MKRVLRNFVLILSLLAPVAATAGACDTKSAAWYVSSPQDIDDLERIGFNLFFYNRADFDVISRAEQDQFIQQGIDALDGCSQLVLPIDSFLTRSWSADDGMQKFVQKWGASTQTRVYGFLLKDDVVTAPFPSAQSVRSDALWVYQWYYQEIRKDGLAVGKKIIVTLPFWLLAENGSEVGNPVNDYHFAIRPEYAANIPPRFFEPGVAWDIVMPYWYPHRAHISVTNEVYIMDVLNSEMAAMFPASSVMPIIQTADEPIDSEFFALGEHDGAAPASHQYDLSIQYDNFIKNGLLSEANAAIAYYSANGHGTVCNNLLHRNCVRDASSTNLYYREAEKLNLHHFELFGPWDRVLPPDGTDTR